MITDLQNSLVQSIEAHESLKTLALDAGDIINAARHDASAIICRDILKYIQDAITGTPAFGKIGLH